MGLEPIGNLAAEPSNKGGSIEFPGAKLVLVLGHVNAFAAKANAFHFQTSSLLECGFKLQLDLSTCANDPLPGQGTGGRRP